jgi:hypothetical protein
VAVFRRRSGGSAARSVEREPESPRKSCRRPVPGNQKDLATGRVKVTLHTATWADRTLIYRQLRAQPRSSGVAH